MFLIGVLHHPASFDAFSALSWRFAVIVAVIYLARNAVIRSREFYVDARAYTWDGPGGALLAALQAKKSYGIKTPGRKLPHWLHLLRLHPSASERVAALRQPDRMLRAGILLPGIIGLAFGIGAPPATFVLNFLTQGIDPRLGGQVATSLYMFPLAGLAGVAIWRDTYSSIRRGRSDLVAMALAMSSAAGIIIGFRLSFMDYIGVSPDYPGVTLAFLLLTLFFLWVRSGAYWWLSSGVARPVLLTACLASMVLGTFVLTAIWFSLSVFNLIAQRVGDLPGAPFPIVQLVKEYLHATNLHPITLLLLGLLWLHPAMPRLIGTLPTFRDSVLRHRGFQVLHWALAYLALIITVRLVVRTLAPPELRAVEQFRLELFYAFVLLAVVLQGGLALLMSLRRPVATIGEACFCTIVAGLSISTVALVVNVAVGGGIDLPFVIVTACLFVNYGALAALPMAALGSCLRFAAAGFRPLSIRAAPLVAR